MKLIVNYYQIKHVVIRVVESEQGQLKRTPEVQCIDMNMYTIFSLVVFFGVFGLALPVALSYSVSCYCIRALLGFLLHATLTFRHRASSV
jgi:uncharacterized membrane protein (GlpM family)